MITNRYYPSRFRQDHKRVKAQGKDIPLLMEIMDRLQNEETLEASFVDHDLKGNWAGYRECHLSPNWLLVYIVEKEDDRITFARTGSHSEIFD